MKELIAIILAGLISVLVLSQAGEAAKWVLIIAYLLGMIYFARQKRVRLSGRQMGVGLAGGVMMILIWQAMMYAAGWGIWMGTVAIDWVNLLLWLSLGGLILVWLNDYRVDQQRDWRERLIKSLLAALWMMFFGSVGWLGFVSLVLLWYLVFGNKGKDNFGLSIGFLLGYYVWQSLSNFHIISDELQAYGLLGPNLWMLVYWLLVIWQVDRFKKKIEINHKKKN